MSSLIIAVIGEKGGCGKSTIACNLAAWWAQTRKVMLVDADPQGTAVAWGDARADAPVKAVVSVVGVGNSVRKQVGNLAQDHETVLIDTPGRSGSRTMGALLSADIALIPCLPSGPDLWALGESIELVRSAQEGNPDLRVGILCNGLVRTTLTKQAQEALAEYGDDALPCSLGRRTAFAEAMTSGYGVHELDGSGAAATEIAKLAGALESLNQEVNRVA